jgi:phospholipid-binding lipoprotein MlaA
MKEFLKQSVKLLIVFTAIWLSACATTQQNARVAKIDPLEPMNRAVFSFNETLDDYVVKPVAKAYKFVLPQMVRTGVTNFFSNIGDIFVAVNNLLQGKPKDAASDVGRVVVNTTVGVLGLIDVASDAGLEKHKEDFGQTLGVWGISDGPYLVLPILGPSNFRDTVGEVVDIKTDLVQSHKHLSVETKNELTGLRVVNRRANLLDASELIEEAAFDKYSFTRDAYLQRRKNMIYDGNPPIDKEE